MEFKKTKMCLVSLLTEDEGMMIRNLRKVFYIIRRPKRLLLAGIDRS